MNTADPNGNDLPKLDFHGAVPLLAQVARHYRERIQTNAIPCGTRLPTCLELGRSIGLAPQTINRAFDLLAQEGLVYRRRSMGTIVGSPSEATFSPSARKKRRSQTMAPPVCMVSRRVTQPPMDDDLLSDYLDGLMEGFNTLKCRFELAHLQTDESALDFVRALVESGQTRGFVNMLLDADATEYLLEKRFPMVSLGLDLTAQGVPSVTADHVGGYAEAWQHISKLGHRRAAFFGSEDDNFPLRLRECRAGRELSPVAPPLQTTVAVPTTADFDAFWQRLAQEFGPPSAKGRWPTLFFTQTDFIAARLIRTLQAHRIHVPRQVSVIGFNDTLTARNFNPTITTLAKPRAQMAQVAAQCLFDVMRKHSDDKEGLRVLPVRLVQRETCAPPPR